MSETKIRLALHGDVDDIVKLGELMHAESPIYQDQPYSPEKSAIIGHDCVDKAACFVAEVSVSMAPVTIDTGATLPVVEPCPPVVVGMAAAYVTPAAFTDVVIGSDYLVYLAPACRGGKAFAQLVGMMEAWAFGAGADFFNPGITTGEFTEQIARAYEALGYTRAGIRMTKRLRG